MTNYIIRRLLLVLPVTFGVLVTVFLVLHMAPGDPVMLLLNPAEASVEMTQEDYDRIRHRLGLDRPLYVQFADYVWHALQLDFGDSFLSGRPIFPELMRRLPNTIELGLFSLFLAYLIAIPAGVIAAIRPYSIIDTLSMGGALWGVSMPGFWLAYILIMVFALHFRVLPPTGRGGPIWTIPGFKSILMPAFVLAVGPAAAVTRLMRSELIEVMQQDYIKSARAKGLRETAVILRHGLKNALIPVLTMLGMQVGLLVAGSVIIETVFAWPGVGYYMVTAIWQRDYPVVQSAVLVIAVSVILGNLLSDILYAYVDPRIRYD
jgi:peptide/nickel transport system permease protein